MSFCKQVVSKVILVPCFITKQLNRDNADHGEATINNAATVKMGTADHVKATVNMCAPYAFLCHAFAVSVNRKMSHTKYSHMHK